MRLIAALLSLLLATSALAKDNKTTTQVLAFCTESKGHTFNISPHPHPGWDTDGISKGRIQLVVHRFADGVKWIDVLYLDAWEQWVSSIADGFDVYTVPQPGPTRMALIVAVSKEHGVVQQYLFDVDNDGVGQVVWTTTRGKHPFPKMAMFRAECVGNERAAMADNGKRK